MIPFIIGSAAQIYLLIVLVYVVAGYTSFKSSPLLGPIGSIVEPPLNIIKRFMPQNTPFDFSPAVLVALVLITKTIILSVLGFLF
jgi:uncharacterized protein YggT (Ycf19 family)